MYVAIFQKKEISSDKNWLFRSSDKSGERFETSKYLQNSLLSTPKLRNKSKKPLNKKAPLRLSSMVMITLNIV